ncbi:MAG: hypothetical protein QOE82_1399 [Thermoanaerobaculia bacterium]|jgi:hypothetical protein|nr:hypothetical protein [Thermoanaerobaculia bacterium]
MPSNPVAKVLYAVRPEKGLSSQRQYLSTNADGKLVDLWSEIDASGRQWWEFKPIHGQPNVYNIEVYDGMSSKSQGRYLSCTSNRAVDLWKEDDGSGRQRWRLQAVTGTNNLFNIIAEDKLDERYLSCVEDGTVVDRWKKDDGSGRQRWQLLPEDLVLVGNPEFNIDAATVTYLPDFVLTERVENQSSVEQNTEFTFTRHASLTSRFEYKAGMEMTVGMKIGVEAGFPLAKVVEENHFSITLSASATYGHEQTVTDSREYRMPLRIPANTSLTAKATIRMGELDVPYKIKLRSPKTKQIVISEGVWHVQAAGSVTYSVAPTK